MCEIYEFPRPVKLPRDLEIRLEESAKEYVNTLNGILQFFRREEFDDEELTKVMEEVLLTYLQSVDKAVDELDL